MRPVALVALYSLLGVVVPTDGYSYPTVRVLYPVPRIEVHRACILLTPHTQPTYYHVLAVFALREHRVRRACPNSKTIRVH